MYASSGTVPDIPDSWQLRTYVHAKLVARNRSNFAGFLPAYIATAAFPGSTSELQRNPKANPWRRKLLWISQLV